jgi:hypothetical protein
MGERTASGHDALSELVGLELGDSRRAARIRRIVEAMQEDPGAHFPTAVETVAEREALYRIFSNAHVTHEALLAPHATQTVQRMSEVSGRPLVVIDKTAFVFNGESERDGLERLGVNRHGFDAFFALAVSSQRKPLGVLAVDPIDANLGRSGTEAWLPIVEASAKHAEALRPIYVMDREADAYGLFSAFIEHGRDFVIRVAHDRWVREHGGAAKEFLRDIAARGPVIVKRQVRLSRRTRVGTTPSSRRRHPPRDARDVVLHVRSCPITLPKPAKLRGVPSSLAVHLVQVLEHKPPPGTAPVEWLLLTTLPIGDAVSVAAIVDTYRARWTIEEYFKALKTGCNYEKRQLESRHALLNALGVLAPLAWRLLALRSAAEDDPEAPASSLMALDEIHVLRKMSKDIKLGRAPTVEHALLALARLGGHFPQNGRPGWLVIWRGLEKVLERVEGYRLARAEM